MQLFYAEKRNIEAQFLSADESKHAIRVLRKVDGDSILILDGKGNLYEATISDANSKKCGFRIVNTEHFENKLLPLHIAIAPTKNIDRFEFFLEKAIELGVGEVTPIFVAHSERKKLNEERLEKRLIAACKQAKSYFFPTLNKAVSFSDFMAKKNPSTTKLIAHCEENSERTDLTKLEYSETTTILIGPEGDFSLEEIQLAKSNGYTALNLGDRRLRTETAGIYCAAAFALKH